MGKRFTSLNHPEPDENGVMRYTLFEIAYSRVADGLTSTEVDAYVEKNGEWDT